MTLMSALKKLVPIASTITAIAVVPPAPGWKTPLQALEEGKPKEAVQTFVAGMTGMELGEHANFDLLETLNPVDLKHAPYPKVALWSSLSMEGISKIGTWIRSIFSDVVPSPK